MWDGEVNFSDLPDDRDSADKDCDRAVEYLWGATGAPKERIRELLIAEVARLGGDAVITRYVHVLAASNVRMKLRRANAAP